MYNIKFYVISLKNKEEYIKSTHYKNLLSLTNKIILSKGIILNQEQSNKYTIYSKSSIGITLAHIKVWKNIKKKCDRNYNNYSIIFEDDTMLNINSNNFKTEIKNIIDNYNFDIYKLHSDFDNGFTSMAAYIVNNSSIDKILNTYKIILGHIDFDLYILKLLNKIVLLTHSYNIFITDESVSSNRKDNYNILKILNGIKLYMRP